MDGPMREALERYQRLYQQTMSVDWWHPIRHWRLARETDRAYALYKLKERRSWEPLP